MKTNEPDEILEDESSETAELPRPQAPPIESRFLFVDISAMRAKQLRRGARPRLLADDEDLYRVPIKPERVAMEEVKRGLVLYELPDGSKPVKEG